MWTDRWIKVRGEKRGRDKPPREGVERGTAGGWKRLRVSGYEMLWVEEIDWLYKSLMKLVGLGWFGYTWRFRGGMGLLRDWDG